MPFWNAPMSPETAATGPTRQHFASAGAVLRLLVLLAAIAIYSLTPAMAAAEAPRVVVTIRPLHGLVAGVIAGVAEPGLLVAGAQSPHHFALGPSGARQLQRADLVFVSGVGLMPALEDAVARIAPHAFIIDLSRTPGLRLLARRNVAHGHGGEAESGNTDPHFWLDPDNAKAMVFKVSSVLAKRDPAHAARYVAGAAAMTERLDRLAMEIDRQLSPYRTHPFLVFHDAFQYFETRFGLNALGAIAPAPETRPGAQHLSATRRKIDGPSKVCLFGEPGAQPALLAMMARAGSARTAELDPLGRSQQAGPEHYFAMMRAIAASMTACFSAP